MKKYIIKNKDGSQQYVMPAVHDTRKKAEETLMGYVHNLNKFSKNYLSLFDFIIEKECTEPNEIVTDFESAKQIVGPTSFIFAEELVNLQIAEINLNHVEALNALNQLFTIAQAWNIMDGFVPDFSDWNQDKWFPWFRYDTDSARFVLLCAHRASTTSASVNPRLCFKTLERAEQFGRQFDTLYNIAFL